MYYYSDTLRKGRVGSDSGISVDTPPPRTSMQPRGGPTGHHQQRLQTEAVLNERKHLRKKRINDTKVWKNIVYVLAGSLRGPSMIAGCPLCSTAVKRARAAITMQLFTTRLSYLLDKRETRSQYNNSYCLLSKIFATCKSSAFWRPTDTARYIHHYSCCYTLYRASVPASITMWYLLLTNLSCCCYYLPPHTYWE